MGTLLLPRKPILILQSDLKSRGRPGASVRRRKHRSQRESPAAFDQGVGEGRGGAAELDVHRWLVLVLHDLVDRVVPRKAGPCGSGELRLKLLEGVPGDAQESVVDVRCPVGE